MCKLLSVILLLSSVCIAQIQPSAPGSSTTSDPQRANSNAQKAEISGQVFDSATGQPLKKTWVSARLGERGGRSGSTAVTDAEGRFLLRNLDAGRYFLSAQRNGYVPQTYGQRNAGEQGTTISLNASQRLTDIVFHLIQGGVVSGRVVDEDSEPLSRVQVQAMQYRYAQGRRRLFPAGMGVSDDRGEYRIFGVRPGQVYVRAMLRGFGQFAGNSSGEVMDSSAPSETTSYPPVFYPGVKDAGQAAPLSVRGGDELRVDFSMTAERSYSVSGRVGGGAQGTSGRGVWVMLAKRGEGEFAFGPGMNTTVREDNTFTFKQVLPGSYNLIAQQQDDKFSASGRVELEVRVGDVQGLVVSLFPKVEINGRVTFEGGNPSAKPTSIRISLSPEDVQDFMRGAYAQAKDDGTFTFQAAPDERYKISVFGGPAEMYLKSASDGRQDVLERGFSPGGNRALDLVFATGGKVSGTISTPDNKAEPGVTVVLAPEQRLGGLADRVRTATTDQNGKYQIQGLRPGSYRAYAFEHLEPGAYEDEDWLKRFADQSQTLQLSAASQQNLDLKPISAVADGRQ